MYGVQDSARSVTPGWASRAPSTSPGRRSWLRAPATGGPPCADIFWGWKDEDAFGEQRRPTAWVRQTSRSRYSQVTAGLRGGGRQGRRLRLYSQVLVGGFRARFQTDFCTLEAWDVELANSACDSGRHCGGVHQRKPWWTRAASSRIRRSTSSDRPGSGAARTQNGPAALNETSGNRPVELDCTAPGEELAPAAS